MHQNRDAVRVLLVETVVTHAQVVDHLRKVMIRRKHDRRLTLLRLNLAGQFQSIRLHQLEDFKLTMTNSLKYGRKVFLFRGFVKINLRTVIKQLNGDLVEAVGNRDGQGRTISLLANHVHHLTFLQLVRIEVGQKYIHDFLSSEFGGQMHRSVTVVRHRFYWEPGI